jgi:hypothetical protein
MNFSLVILDTTVKLREGANSEQVSTLDKARKEQKDLTFAEHPLGVQILRDGVAFALVPWGQVRQCVYEVDAKAVKK